MVTQPGGHTRRVAVGAASLLIGMGITLLCQLAYAAITGRIVSPASFGAYAAALTSAGLTALIALGGLEQAAARTPVDSDDKVRDLISAAWYWGIAGSLLTFASAPLVVWIWGIPASLPVSLGLSLGMPFASVAGVLAGALRRRGRTTTVAWTGTVGTVIGLLLGGIVVLAFRTPWALSAPLVVGNIATLLLLRFATRIPIAPRGMKTDFREDLSYGAKTTLLNVARYTVNLTPAWAVSRVAGTSGLGQWNRATTLVSVPLESAQRALTTALFPELRPSGPVFAKSGVFQELVGVLIAVSTPLALYGFILAPDFTTLILGSGWEDAASWASWAAVIAALSITTVPLGAAFEAQGRFGAATWTWLSRTIIILLSVAGTLLTGDPLVAIAGLAAATFVGMLVQFVLATRMGLLRMPRLFRDVFSTLALCLPFVVTAAATTTVPGLTHVAVLGIGAVLFAAQIACQSLLRGMVPGWNALLARLTVALRSERPPDMPTR